MATAEPLEEGEPVFEIGDGRAANVTSKASFGSWSVLRLVNKEGLLGDLAAKDAVLTWKEAVRGKQKQTRAVDEVNQTVTLTT